MSREFPRTLGNYTLLARLGHGGMGDVFAARADGFRGIQRLCVVKTLKPEHAADREYVARFLDEARVVMQLTHRNICSVFDVGEIDGQHFLAMDLVRGRDLRALWTAAREAGRPLAPSLALYVGIEILDGLDYAHRATDVNGQPLGIVHRDVSPQNVMLSFEGDVQIIDFGLAKSSQKMERTESNIVHGKVQYMAPEQIRGRPADVRADVFAVGVTLYELLSHERYYEAVPQHLLTANASTGTHVPDLWHTLDDDLRGVLRTALAPNPDERVATAGKLADALRGYAARRSLRGDAASIRARMRELFGGERHPWELDEENTPALPRPVSMEKRPRTQSHTIERSAAPAPPEVQVPGIPDRARERAATGVRSLAGGERAPGVVDKTIVLDPSERSSSYRAQQKPPQQQQRPAPDPEFPHRTEVIHRDGGTLPNFSEGRAPPPPPPSSTDSGAIPPPPVRKTSKAESRRAATLKLAGAGLALVGLFVLFFFFAPWQKQQAPERVRPAADAPAADKLRFMNAVCPSARCVRALAGKEGAKDFDRDVDKCFGFCVPE